MERFLWAVMELAIQQSLVLERLGSVIRLECMGSLLVILMELGPVMELGSLVGLGTIMVMGPFMGLGTIMVMDIVFSIDSVITAVGLAEHLIVMIAAVIIAVVIMMVFIDPISDFINKHAEMKILALVFIAAIGVLLVLDSLGITTGIEVLDMHLEKVMVYFAMVFAIVLELIQMRFNSNLERYRASLSDNDTGSS